jgi:hypothetical protein
MIKLNSFNKPLVVSIMLLSIGFVFVAHHAVMSPQVYSVCLVFFCAFILSSVAVFFYGNLIGNVVVGRQDRGSIIPSLLEKPPRFRHTPICLEFRRTL